MRKNLGDKGKYIKDEDIENLKNIYLSNKENEFCKIYENGFFGYTKVIIEQSHKENGEIKKDKKGNIKADSNKRGIERVPLLEDIDEYYTREVKPHLPDSWMDRSKDKIGYEINFTKYFYKFSNIRSLMDISKDLQSLNNEISKLSSDIFNEK